MRNALIVVVLVMLVFIGIPLFVNYQDTGDVLARESSAITAIFSFWFELAAGIGSGSSAPTVEGGRFS
jgi:hypothetical protein